MTRPGDRQTRDEIVQFRVDHETKRQMSCQASKRGLTMSDYLRDILLDQLFDDAMCTNRSPSSAR